MFKNSFALCALWACAVGVTFGAEPSAAPDVIVAPDGSGKYRTVLEAVNAAPQLTSGDKPWVILIKPGTYRELIYIQREKRFITLRGEEAEKTVITFDLYANLKGPDGNIIGT